MHLKVSKIFIIVFKNCFFAFCDTSRNEHHLDFRCFPVYWISPLSYSASSSVSFPSLVSRSGQPNSRSHFQHDPAPQWKLIALIWLKCCLTRGFTWARARAERDPTGRLGGILPHLALNCKIFVSSRRWIDKLTMVGNKCMDINVRTY